MLIRKQRKTEHLNMARDIVDGPSSSGLEDINLVNNSIPEMDLAQISTRSPFLGKTLEFPVIINALTGGTFEACRINKELALCAKKYGLAMAVGSQRIALDEPGIQNTFNIVRQVNPNGVILANLSAAATAAEVKEAVSMIAADGVQLHFNIPQELAMPEGERCFKGIMDNVARIVDSISVPVIAKEVGFGLSQETVGKLFAAGVRIFDIAGRGGTNFVIIEDKRQGKFEGHLDEWGISTACSLAEVVALGLPITIIASGGIREAMDAGKALALGADLVAMAAPFLKVLLNGGPEQLDYKMEGLLYRLKAVLFMAGARDCHQLKTCPVIITGYTAEWLRARGIDASRWASGRADESRH
jgi:isopentenyl-diphosphate delta-isomerase